MVRYFSSENVLEDFYNTLGKYERVHIPRSDVFYVRLALYNRTGKWFTLQEVERALVAEGFLNKRDSVS